MSAEAIDSPLRPENLVDPSISRGLRANYEALANDLEQANQFATERQNELAGKSNEYAHLKQLFDKAQSDLAHLHGGILALREERHKLANSVMRMNGLELRLKMLSEEREQLVSALRETQRREKVATDTLNTRDAHIAELTMQVMLLKEELRHAQARAAEGQAGHRTLKSAAAERAGL